ncbi:hypothetical protein [Sporosarcina trichiuri]|uniref:hypothetical protein n=1 Tax=Sporosarcina trichiuri TaxID=3056445 RepID=UPI0025B390F5|nr:hypothetical protein [Sporosarcina sp. 0.2-SM1T-5]WJY28292.1 hypothetical protein QWT68_04735 [Sporosarcina sp. 0.2-SM1T-5]
MDMDMSTGLGVFALLPLLMMLVNLALIAGAVWFAIALIRSQKERNELLRRIAEKMDRKDLL